MNLMLFFEDDRFYRDNPDIAKKEAVAAGDDVDCITELLREGVDVNSSYDDGNSGLMMATMNGRVDVIRCFLENGVNVNAVALFGHTALDSVDEALRNQEEVKHLLERAGALHGSEICATCGKTTRDTTLSGKMMKCGKCKRIHYCGRRCQRDHWRKHKKHCVESS